MSDPMDQRPVDAPPPESQPRKSASPLIWLLLLVVLLALGWYFYNRSASDNTAVVAPTTDVIEPTAESAAAQAEREAAAASERRRTRVASATRPASPTPSLSEATPMAGMSPKPDYPAEALRAGETGTVLLRVDVGADGVPTNVDFVDRSGSRALDREAMNTVKKWRFNPAKRGGQAVASQVTVPVDFVLPEQG